MAETQRVELEHVAVEFPAVADRVILELALAAPKMIAHAAVGPPQVDEEAEDEESEGGHAAEERVVAESPVCRAGTRCG